MTCNIVDVIMKRTSTKEGASSGTKLEKVRCRSNCDPKFIVKINKNLSEVQSRKIGCTTFKWLMKMPEKLYILGKLLRELAVRWDERGGGFRVRRTIVPITPLNVCFALGLRIVGEKVVLDEVGDSENRTKGLFGGGKVTAASVYEKLTELHSDEHVEDFYDLESIDKYSSGVAVFEDLVGSLSRTRGRLSEAKNAHQIHLNGCTTVLQRWAMDHLALQAEQRMLGGNCIRRFVLLGNGGIRGRQITVAFKKTWVVHDLVASYEEVQDEVVKEALREAGSGFCHWRQPVYDIESIHDEHKELVAQNKDLQKRISKLEEEYRTLKDAIQAGVPINLATDGGIQKKEIHEDIDYNVVICASVKERSPCFTEDVEIAAEREDTVNHEGSNMYTRLKGEPRNRVLSGRVRTPRTTYKRKRKKQKSVV
ncbi:hypothetical protein SESBI_03653 [Sesbania bispinosa]|nr:hypothetical protein SESBI_03653 [Sesbania bispinosa]